MVQSNLSPLLFEKTFSFALKLRTTGIFAGLKYREKLFDLISNGCE